MARQNPLPLLADTNRTAMLSISVARIKGISVKDAITHLSSAPVADATLSGSAGNALGAEFSQRA